MNRLRRHAIIVVPLLAVLALALPAWAQAPRTDTVALATGEVISNCKVLKESLRGVEVDKDLDGRSDITYSLKQVKEIKYGDEPQYLRDARLDKNKPGAAQKYIDALKNAYTDSATSKWILQHAYYEIARKYEEMATTDDKFQDEAVKAYEKLLNDIPESRYAVQVRFNLAEMNLYRGEAEQARKVLDALIGKGYGSEAENQARLLQARSFLLVMQGEEAEKALAQIKDDEVKDAELRHRLDVLRAASQAARGNLDTAYAALVKVIDAAAPTEDSVRAEAYAVIGDLLKQRGRSEEALLAYLRVYFMYPDADTTTRARALVGATLCLKRMNRVEDARTFQAEVMHKFPGSFWEKKLNEE
jgi:tetratricopeptide (TPR) repeat protein